MKNRLIPFFMVFSLIVGSTFCMEVPHYEKAELNGLKKCLKTALTNPIISDDSLTALQSYALGKESVQKIIKQALHTSPTQELQENIALVAAVIFDGNMPTENTTLRHQLLIMLRITVEKLQAYKSTNTTTLDKEHRKQIKQLNRALKAILTEDNPSTENIKIINSYISAWKKVSKTTKCCFGCIIPCIKRLFPHYKEQLTRTVCLNLYEQTVILLLPSKKQK